MVILEFLECLPQISDCEYNQNLYDGMANGSIDPFTYHTFFRSYVLNVFDSDKPLVPTVTNDKMFFGDKAVDIDHHFNYNELITKENYIINQSKKESYYRYKKQRNKNSKKT
jgi:hypothetical protein